MEDRYLFKAKRVDNGEWVKGSYLYDYGRNIHYIFANEIVCPNCINDCRKEFSLQDYEVDPSTICQCTGLKDKNGNLIWENDIVNCLAEECCGYIGWNEDEAGFYFNVLLEDGTYEEEHIYDYVDCMDVIGNVFDNPELLGRNDE